MTSVLQLSELARSFLSLWSLLPLLVGLFSAVRAVTQKRLRYAAFALLPVVCSYGLWQVLFDLHLFANTANANAISRRLGAVPIGFWLLFLAVLTVAALFNLAAVIRYEKRSITPNAVKICLDQIPCGVCCFNNDGIVLFANVCMNRLSMALTHAQLPDGWQLYGAAGSVQTVNGRVWRFTGREMMLDKERLHEIIASDVTAEYAKTQALSKDKEELSRLAEELKAYTLGIDETVRRQEILQAKVNIHDEMNRLMLSTVAAEKTDGRAEDRIFSLWQQNALLLCMQADKTADPKAVIDVEKLAKALHIRLVWQSDLPDALNDEQRSLFFAAAQEAIANAAKHAGAKQMAIGFEQTGQHVVCRFTNDGKRPTGEVRFAGGLYNLALLAKKQGATVSIAHEPAFTLSLRFKISRAADA